MQTRRNTLAVFGLLALGLIAGCGGGGSDDSDNHTPSPFAGSYAGTFTTSIGQRGTGTATVSTNGNVTGAIINTTINQNGTLSGKVDNDGNADFKFQYPGLQAEAKGTVSLSSVSGKLTGNLTQTVDGNSVGTIAISLTKQP